jgi:hypothetical protein
MDPTTCLDHLRYLVDMHTEGNPVDLDDLVEHLHSLDQWLTKGGFLPEPWPR